MVKLVKMTDQSPRTYRMPILLVYLLLNNKILRRFLRYLPYPALVSKNLIHQTSMSSSKVIRKVFKRKLDRLNRPTLKEGD